MVSLANREECACCSGKLAIDCCLPLLKEQRKAKTPVALMRSRFTAYALGGYGAYLFKTWSPDQRAGLNEVSLSIRSCNWSRLEVIDNSQKGHEAIVEFKAYYLDDDFNEHVHYEISLFHRIRGAWYYVSALGDYQAKPQFGLPLG